MTNERLAQATEMVEGMIRAGDRFEKAVDGIIARLNDADAEVSRLQKENERLRTALETLLDGAVFADGAVMRCGICGQRDSDGHAEGLICHEARSLLAELEHTDE